MCNWYIEFVMSNTAGISVGGFPAVLVFYTGVAIITITYFIICEILSKSDISRIRILRQAVVGCGSGWMGW